ncbi:hypothetical protein CVT24_008494, partial [Panaeolus cyanescens]
MTSTNSSSLGYRVSKGALQTAPPPIPKAYEWATHYHSTPTAPLLDMSQGVPGVPPPVEVQRALGEAAGALGGYGYCRWDGEVEMRRAMVGE